MPGAAKCIVVLPEDQITPAVGPRSGTFKSIPIHVENLLPGVTGIEVHKNRTVIVPGKTRNASLNENCAFSGTEIQRGDTDNVAEPRVYVGKAFANGRITLQGGDEVRWGRERCRARSGDDC
jgi:hypothetical protein